MFVPLLFGGSNVIFWVDTSCDAIEMECKSVRNGFWSLHLQLNSSAYHTKIVCVMLCFEFDIWKYVHTKFPPFSVGCSNDIYLMREMAF